MDLGLTKHTGSKDDPKEEDLLDEITLGFSETAPEPEAQGIDTVSHADPRGTYLPMPEINSLPPTQPTFDTRVVSTGQPSGELVPSVLHSCIADLSPKDNELDEASAQAWMSSLSIDVIEGVQATDNIQDRMLDWSQCDDGHR